MGCLGIALVIASVYAIVHQSRCLAPPSYTSPWLNLDSVKGPREYRLEHGLGETPIKVDLQVNPYGGTNDGFHFSGIGSAQTSADVDKEIGGVVYMYNEHVIIIKCPNANNGKGMVTYTGTSSDWTNKNADKTEYGKVRARAWRVTDFPSPDYDSGWLPISVLSGSTSKLEVDTYQSALKRKYAAVRVKITDQGQLHNMTCEAQGSSLAYTGGKYWGGVIYRFVGSFIHVWAPAYNSNNGLGKGSLCNMNGDWGDTDSGFGLEGTVRIQIWQDLGSEDRFSIVIHSLDNLEAGNEFPYDQSDQADLELDLVDAKIYEVQASGFNLNPVFGGALFPESYGTGYGGVVFAYSQTSVRVWRPGKIFYANTAWGESPTTSATSGGLVVKIYKVTKCMNPVPVANSWNVISTPAPYYYGTNITYHCLDNYRIVSGDDVLVCDHFGWSGNLPVCDRVTTTTSTTTTTTTTSTTTTTTTTPTTTTTTTTPTTTTTTPTNTTTTTMPSTTTTTTTPTTTTSTTTPTTTTTTTMPTTTTATTVPTTTTTSTTTQSSPPTTATTTTTTTASALPTATTLASTAVSPQNTTLSIKSTTQPPSPPTSTSALCTTAQSVTTTDLQTSTNTANATVTGTPGTCLCFNICTEYFQNVENVKESVIELQKKLLVDKDQTSKAYRAKNSAHDDRTVSRSIGWVGASICIFLLVSVIVSDLSKAVSYFVGSVKVADRR